MNKNLYSIFDSVALVFNNPFVALNDNDARRSFTQAISEVPHKQDYALYSLGSFTDHDGVITPSNPVRIYSGFDVKNAEVIPLPAALKEQG